MERACAVEKVLTRVISQKSGSEHVAVIDKHCVVEIISIFSSTYAPLW